MPPMKPKPGSLASKLSQVKPRKPLWEGPEGTGWNGGVTQSLIKQWLSCRERCRVRYVEGWKPQAKFHPRMDYGSIWHLCEERFAAGNDWRKPLLEYCMSLSGIYPFQREEVYHWYKVCETQFPIYVDWWKDHPEVVERTPLLQEYAFDVPYRLPSGRTVRLRGKFDGVDLIGKGREAGIYLFETKTKGEIDELEIQRNLSFDLQTMLYLTALYEWVNDQCQDDPGMAEMFAGPIRGVRYNVVRRPLSGGKGSIKQGKGTKGAKCTKCKETGRVVLDKKIGVEDICPKCEGRGRIGAEPPEKDQDFFARLGDVIRGAVGQEWEVGVDENYFFRRWRAEIGPSDVERFRRECLDPILEQMCDWYGQITGRGGPVAGNYRTPLNFRHPFGASNAIDDYGSSDVDQYLQNGSTVGLVRSEEMFGELKS